LGQRTELLTDTKVMVVSLIREEIRQVCP
jgi:hypothetical protein